MLEWFPYALKSARQLNAVRNEREVRGCLVRLDRGVACLQSWPEFGDPPLEEVLADFCGPCRLAISRQARICCEADAAARRAGVHLLEGRTVPASHYSLPWGTSSVPAGFRTVKIKAGPNGEALQSSLRKLPAHIRIRLDFNESLDPSQFRAVWQALAPFHSRIDFVEDPTPYMEEDWRAFEAELGCRLAVDRWAGEAPFLRVWKPARQSWPGAGQIVVTSNMDHPVGQVYAAYCAATLPQDVAVAGCGLVTHHLFDRGDPFIAAMGPATAEFPPVPGTGVGFDPVLESLPWRSC